MSETETGQTFWDHLDELRSALIRIICASLLCGVVAFFFKELLFKIVLAPTSSDFITYTLINKVGSTTGVSIEPFSIDLINTALASQFLIHMRAAFIAGAICASPYILYCLMRFIAPALYSSERKTVFTVISCGYVMFALGMLLCYFVIFPMTFHFLGTYQVSDQVENLISLESYISTFLRLTLLMGIVFELPMVCWLVAKLGFIEAATMRQYRRHAIVVILILAAIITPTSDVFTLMLVGVPMWLLYEVSIIVVSRTNKTSLSND